MTKKKYIDYMYMYLFCTNLPSINRMQYISLSGAIGNLMSLLFLLRLYLSIKHILLLSSQLHKNPLFGICPLCLNETKKSSAHSNYYSVYINGLIKKKHNLLCTPIEIMWHEMATSSNVVCLSCLHYRRFWRDWNPKNKWLMFNP